MKRQWLILLSLLILLTGSLEASPQLTIGILHFQTKSPELMVQGEQLAQELYLLLQNTLYLTCLSREELQRELQRTGITREEIQPGGEYRLDLDLLILGEIDHRNFKITIYSPRNNSWYKSTGRWEGRSRALDSILTLIKKEILPEGQIIRRDIEGVTLTIDKNYLFFPGQRLLVTRDYSLLIPEKAHLFPSSPIIIGEIQITQIENGMLNGAIRWEDYPLEPGDKVGLPSQAARLGGITLHSQPKGSRVYLEDKFLGITPLFLKDIPARTYRFTFALEGYEEKREILTISEGSISNRSFELYSLPAMVLATSNIRAQISIEGEIQGVTPWSGALRPGYYRILAESPGYPPVSQSLYLRSGREYHLFFTIQGEDGSLEVVTKPNGAFLYLNGKKIGETPLRIPSLTPGYYLLELEKEYYQTHQEEILISSSKETRREIILKEAPGIFTLFSVPSRANVTLDGRGLGITPLTLSLPPGIYEIKMEKEGYSPSFITIHSSPGKEEEIRLSLTQLFGSIEIFSHPMGASVYENGVYLGKTPLLLEKHPAGPRTFTLKDNGLKGVARVTIPAWEKKSIFVELKREPIIGGNLLGTYDYGMGLYGLHLSLHHRKERYQIGIEAIHLFHREEGGYGEFSFTEVWGIFSYYLFEGLGFYGGYQEILNPVKITGFSTGLVLASENRFLQGRMGLYLREDITGFLWDLSLSLPSKEYGIFPLLKLSGRPLREFSLSIGIAF